MGMLGDLAAAFPVVRHTFSEASDVLGYDLWSLVQDGPEAGLNQTQKTQPALLTAGVAVWHVWQERQGAPARVMGGHSLGEYTALVCSGALDFSDAVALVAKRGEFMQTAVAEGVGAMAAILGLDDEAVAEVCTAAAANEVVEPVNFNAPGQIVIAGHRAAVDRALELAKEKGAKRALILPVSVPSHCSLMTPAAESLADALKDLDIRSPKIPVIHNVDGQARSQADEIREALVRQLHSPVKWVDCVRTMVGMGTQAFIEAGPGKVLAGLGKRIDRNAPVSPVFDLDSLEQALKTASELGDG